MIVPAPRKPIPLITWAAILAASPLPPEIYSIIYSLVTMTMAAPIHTKEKVFSPAGRPFSPRSKPTMPPQTAAQSSLTITDIRNAPSP